VAVKYFAAIDGEWADDPAALAAVEAEHTAGA
jgi:hypothetical protein